MEHIAARYADIYRYVFSRLQNESDAKDAAQNTMERAWKSLDRLRKPESVKSWLFQIRQKTLVIAGTRDMTKKSHTELIARSIPNAELKFLKGDHFIAAKKPDEFNREVERFLRERESGRD